MKRLYLYAGHGGGDPGAISGNRTEGTETIRLRNTIQAKLASLIGGDRIQIDDDKYRLEQVLAAYSPTGKDILLDIHFNAGSASASGCEVFYRWEGAKASAVELCKVVSNCLEIPFRGAKDEKQSARKRIGILGETFQCLLLEVCFISNPSDMASYDRNFNILAGKIAMWLEKQLNS
jgi:N-acetylmuramoyl-L-alanine amidase